jgi:hypothetical protein
VVSEAPVSDSSPTVKDMPAVPAVAEALPPEERPSITSTSFVKPADLEKRRWRWPLLIVGALVSIGAGAFIAWKLGLRERAAEAPAVAAQPDAAPSTPTSTPTPTTATIDAGIPVITPIRDAAEATAIAETEQTPDAAKKKKKKKQEPEGDDDDLDSLRP